MQIFTPTDIPPALVPDAPGPAPARTATRERRPMPHDMLPTLVLAVDENDVERCTMAAFRVVPASGTGDVLLQIAGCRPAVVVLDADRSHLDLAAVCEAAHRIRGTGVLVTMTSPGAAPRALRAGCDAILLKPFMRDLLASRIGRLAREMTCDAAIPGRLGSVGTSQRWPQRRCRRCRTAGVVSFDHASHRRDWYACLSCEEVWVAPRAEFPRGAARG